MYVTLEPCCHYGRTPPCTKSIIEAGISEVHFSIVDPNPKVAGRGRIELERAGIKVFAGEHSEEATEINEAFIKYITTGLPFVTVKFAASLDGKIATRTGNSQWITGEAARKYVQHLRYISDAVMTGANTIIADDPRLTVRLSVKGGIAHKQPLRIVVDGMGRTPPAAQIFSEAGKILLVLGTQVNPETKAKLAETSADILELPTVDGKFDLVQLLKALSERQITSILVEAGGILLGSLFDQRMVDKVIAFLAPIIIGGEQARPAVAGLGCDMLSNCTKLEQVKFERFGPDIMINGYVVR